MARPSTYSAELCDRLRTHFEAGLSFESFAAVIGCGRTTLYDWLKRYPEFQAAREEYEPLALLFWEKLGAKAAAGDLPGFNATAWIFNLKNRFGWRDKSEIATTNDTRITANVTAEPKEKPDYSRLSHAETLVLGVGFELYKKSLGQPYGPARLHHIADCSCSTCCLLPALVGLAKTADHISHVKGGFPRYNSGCDTCTELDARRLNSD